MEYTAEPGPEARGIRSSFVERMMGAATLSVPIYEEVERDTTATGQAAGVVALVAVASAIGGVEHGASGILLGVIMAFVGWIVWAFVTLFIGTRLFAGTSDMGEMLRALGFAQSPGVLNVIGFIPLIGWIVALVVAIWQLVCGIVAVRQALDFTTGKAIITVIIGWIVIWILAVILGMLFGITMT